MKNWPILKKIKQEIKVVYCYENEIPIDKDDISIQNFTISAKCFSKCREFQNVIIKKKCQKIEESAFDLCSKLTTVTINLSDNTQMGNSVFKDCEQLEKVNFAVVNDASLTIGQSSFENCKKLKEVTFDHPELFENESLKVESFAFAKCESLNQFIFPDNCDGNIGTNCFEGCTNLASVSLPNQITQISKAMFKDCQNLVNIDLNNKEITFIDESAFDNCSKLDIEILPQNLVKIGNKAFQKCSLLKINNLPPNIEEIGERAFNECIHFNELTIPSSMKIIHKEAFMNCTELERINNESPSVIIENKAFFKCKKLKEVFTEKKTGFSPKAFKDCAKGLDFFKIEDDKDEDNEEDNNDDSDIAI